MSDQELAEELRAQRNRAHVPEVVNIEKYLSKDYIKSHVLCKLMSSDNLEAMQEHNRVYKVWLDMIIVYYIPLDEMTDGRGMASIPVTADIIRQAGITEKKLYKYAIKNIEEMATIRDLAVVLAELQGLPVEVLKDTQGEVLCISVENNLNGASGILAEGVQLELERMLGDKFYIMPSSIHEVLALKMGAPDELLAMVKSINAEVVEPYEKLTDSLYMYLNGDIVICN